MKTINVSVGDSHTAKHHIKGQYTYYCTHHRRNEYHYSPESHEYFLKYSECPWDKKYVTHGVGFKFEIDPTISEPERDGARIKRFN